MIIRELFIKDGLAGKVGRTVFKFASINYKSVSEVSKQLFNKNGKFGSV